MERKEAVKEVRELREREDFFAPFNATDKTRIEKLYKAAGERLYPDIAKTATTMQ